MATFKPPQITTEKRLSLVLENGEIVFDIDNKHFYTGDGETSGGILITSNISTSATKLSEFENDCGFLNTIIESDPIFVETSGQFALKADLPSSFITKTSELENDSGFISVDNEENLSISAINTFSLGYDNYTISGLQTPYYEGSPVDSDSGQLLHPFANVMIGYSNSISRIK